MIPDDLRVMTIKQPWADLIVRGLKDVENRSWPVPATISLPITIAIHAGARLDPATTATELPRGVVLGLVDIVACVNDHESPWSLPDHWHWVLANPWPLVRPVALRGRQGLMPVPEEAIAAIRAAAKS